jgi:hypothetical protein
MKFYKETTKMKITKEQLKKIISEEMESIATERPLDEFIGPWSKKAKEKKAAKASALADRRGAVEAEHEEWEARMSASNAKSGAERAAREEEEERNERRIAQDEREWAARRKAREERQATADAKPSGDSRIHTAPGGWARKSSLDWDEDIGRFEENRLAKEDLIAVIREEIQDILKER